MESFDAHPLKYYYLHSRWFLSSITHCALYYNHWLIPLGIHSNAIISHRPISLHGKSDLTNRFIDFLSRSNLDFFVGVLTAVKVSLAPTPLLANVSHILKRYGYICINETTKRKGGKKQEKRSLMLVYTSINASCWVWKWPVRVECRVGISLEWIQLAKDFPLFFCSLLCVCVCVLFLPFASHSSH